MTKRNPLDGKCVFSYTKNTELDIDPKGGKGVTTTVLE